jgi:alkanesulfonate monooxygenase SsuD/methylene tetrahydromethanopterin reductase-like flavin-dependent oxidoreductase (luciferase family)
MSVGLVLADMPVAEVAAVASTAEDTGLSHLLLNETSVIQEPATGRDPFIAAAAALRTTSTLHVGTGVAGSVFHSSRHLALTAATLNEQADGRFVLGVGVAHKIFADHIGWPYPSSPLAHMQRYATELNLYSHTGLDFGGGFPIWLAALGDRMFQLAARLTDGVILNWVSPKTVEYAAERLITRGAPRPTMAVFLRVGTSAALTAAAERYWNTFTNYRRHFSHQGLADPDTIVTATCATDDDITALARRIRNYESAGADIVLLHPYGKPPADVHRLLRALYPQTRQTT